VKKAVRVGEAFGRCSADLCLLRRERYNSFYEHLLCTVKYHESRESMSWQQTKVLVKRGKEVSLSQRTA
jgi:hypothetical protein